MAITMRRRFDAGLLRWQARLDTPWADRAIPAGFTVVLFVLLLLPATAQARSLDSSTVLAGALQGMWLIAEGREPVVSVTTDSHVLAQQFSLVLYPLAWVTRVLPPTGTLLVAQAAALALGVVPLWWLARRSASLRVGASAALVSVYCLYPALHDVNLSGFHPESFALPALLAAAVFALGDRRRWFWVCIAVVLVSRADLGIAVAGLGLAMALTGRKQLGAQAAAIGTAWTVVAALVLQPWVGDGSTPHLEVFAAYGDSLPSIVWGMLTSPGEVLADLVRERSFNLFVVLLGPVIFLPVLAPRILVGAVPLQALYLLGDGSDASLFGPQAIPATAFVFVATAFALARLGKVGVEKVTVDPRLLVALLLAGAAFFVQDADSSPYRHPWEWGGRDASAHARERAADAIDPESSVRASPSMLVLLAERSELYSLDPGEVPDARSATEHVDVVVVNEAQLTEWNTTERAVFFAGLETLGFSLSFDDAGVTVWERRS